MDEDRFESMRTRAQDVRAMQLAVMLEMASYEPGTPSYEWAMRRGFARQLAGVIAHTIDSALIRGQLLSRDELPHTRHFADELAKSRLYSDYESIHEVDRALRQTIQATMSMIQRWVDWSEKTYAREYRVRAETEAKLRRADKLMRRQIARVEQTLAAPAPKTVKKRKKVKKECAPMCEKCHKRPVAKDGLCTPCFTWEKNKLGRA